jgi:hypothetical protein
MRIYCIGDIHGDMESFHRVLRENNIVDNNLKVVRGRESILVQMGDVLDGMTRGSQQFHSASTDLDILKF